VSTPVTYTKLGSTAVRAVNGGGFVPDESDIVFDKGVRRIDGWVLCHLKFVLEVVNKDEDGMSNALASHYN